MKYATLVAENERLRAALEEMMVFELTFQNEPDDPTVYSEGWKCCHCDLGDGHREGRPCAETRVEVIHEPSCPLYRAAECMSAAEDLTKGAKP